MTRAEAMQPGDAAAGFDALVAGLREQRDLVSTWRPELSFEDVPAPRTLAPYATAVAATVLDGDTDIASGRLVLLYDPAIGQVGWDWLTEALDNRTAGYGQPSGTVTRVVTEGFGAKESEPAVTGFELRASWSPAVADEDGALDGHLAAWCDALCAAAGLPPLEPGVTALRKPASTTRRRR